MAETTANDSAAAPSVSSPSATSAAVPASTFTSQSIAIPATGTGSNGEIPALLFFPTNDNDEAGTLETDSDEAVSTDATTSRLPAIVLLHDWNGLDESTSRIALRLAQTGCVVLAPDLFGANAIAPDADDAARVAFVDGLSDVQIVQKVQRAISWLAEEDYLDDQRLGVAGFGWSGAHALMTAAHDSRLRVAVDVGGTITYPVLTAQKPGSPLNYIGDMDSAFFAAFAAQDPAFPANEISRLEGRLQEHDRRGEVKTYDAPARFWLDENSPHTALLWRRIEEFLRGNLLSELDPDEDYIDAGYPNEEARLYA